MRSLEEYSKKRDFKKTREPGIKAAAPRRAKKNTKTGPLIFVVQEHHASHLHYDFRLELDGVLKSWAVPKGPSLDPRQKRLAVEVEDHPYDYARFSGTIPKDEYGGGEVFIWDNGTWECEEDPHRGLAKGHLEFTLKGKRLKGKWILLRTRNSSSGSKHQWLLIKRTDDFARTGDSAKLIGHDSTGKTISRTKIVKKNQSEMPDFIEPQLAELVQEPPVGVQWLHEAKYDGYRTQAHIAGQRVQLLTRTGKEWTDRYSPVAKALKKLPVQSAILDGEVVWMDENGISHFQKLQNGLKSKNLKPMHYFVFDLLYLNGEDLRKLPLLERKNKLKSLLESLEGSPIRYSEHFEVSGESFLKASCQLKMEGIVSKLADRPYVSGRHENWVKSKCKMRQEFVIGGFTDAQGSRVGFGALLLGVYEKGKLRYVGKVGTGFDHKFLGSFKKTLTTFEQDQSPFDKSSPRGRGLHWVKPQLVAEIAFSNWTDDKQLRVPVFYGLREDKPADQIREEKAVPAPKFPKKPRRKLVQDRSDKAEGAEIAGLTHPQKILFKKEGITKLQIAEFYQQAAPWMLPHVEQRPLSLLRCPEGNEGSCFFQKHFKEGMAEELIAINVPENDGPRDYVSIESKEGLTALVQQGVLEIHCWNSRKGHVENPDQFVMDFDPGPGVSWKQVLKGVFSMKEMLDHLELESFVKVTGGKGVHIHVPIEPIYTYSQIKEFTATLAKELASRSPKLYTAQMSKALRNKKIFIDYLRNTSGATAIAPYSLRNKPISSVAMPVEWRELEKLPGAEVFTLEKAIKKIATRKQDPWKSYFNISQKISILKAP
jgi:bifunctional non-homologous end joining protein LigD